MSYWGRRAAGLLIRSPYGRYLLLLRSAYVYDPGVWGLPGGRVEDNEDPQDAAVRETEEEIGVQSLRVYTKPISIWHAPDANFEYHTFLALSLSGEFVPVLNWENDGYVWTTENEILSGRIEGRWVHPGVVRSVRALKNPA